MKRYAAKTLVLKPLNANADLPAKQVLWGDLLTVEDHPNDAAKYVLNWKTRRGAKTPYVIAKADTRTTPLLEIIFMDVGQGDGCFVGIPDGTSSKLLLIDAGSASGNNLYRFLKWRQSVLGHSDKYHAAIMTHPDEDHYGGFASIFKDKTLSFDHVYHNGLLEREGPPDADNIGARSSGYCVEVYENHASAKSLLEVPANRGRKKHPNLMWTALSTPQRFGAVSTLSVDHGAPAKFMQDLGDEAKVEILGPIVERDANGKARLREFGNQPGSSSFNKGKTKNGHSILLRLTFGKLNLIFGGDLNRSSEDFLMRYYGGIGENVPLADAVAKARQRLSADLLKCCHHGSADVTDEFLASVNAMGYVVSSGDGESHVHPRPEVLGLLGQQGRGKRPLILCTEILRSSPESLSLSETDDETLTALRKAIGAAMTAATRKSAISKLEKFYEDRMARLVDVYGAINVRTDGETLVIAFLKEKPSSGGKRWHTYTYTHGAQGWQLSGEDAATH
jgi:beta-lactamase superfamily II metal-dependent hydrolase